MPDASHPHAGESRFALYLSYSANMTKMDMSRVTTSLADDGVWIDDPDAPFRLKVTVDIADDLPWLTSLSMYPRAGWRHVAYRNWLASIPLHGVARLAAMVVMGDSELNESLYRRMASSPPDTARIRTVAEWANQVAWPGGASAALSQMWGVSRSTACRWLRSARPQ